MNVKDKPVYELKVYAPDMLCLMRTEKINPRIEGLPPTHVYSIIMNPKEIKDILKVLNDNADKK